MSAEDREELAHEIAFWMQGLDKPLPPLDEHARLVRQLCEQLRALAIMVLLGTGNSDRFHHNRIRSARLRLAFLRRCTSRHDRMTMKADGSASVFTRRSGRARP